MKYYLAVPQDLVNFDPRELD